MLDNDNMIKIIDFGESRISDNDNQFPTLKIQLCGTHGYMDPIKKFENEGFQEKSDLWSMGATLFYILTNQRIQINAKDMNMKAMKIQKIGIKQNQIWYNKLLIYNQLNYHNQIYVKIIHSRAYKDMDGMNQYLRDKFNNKRLLVKNQQNFDIKLIKIFYQLIQIISISKGKQFASTVIEMFKYFNQMKFVNDKYLNNWQNFEICNYLLHLRSLIFLNHYNQIFTLKTPKSGDESIDQKLLINKYMREYNYNYSIYLKMQERVYKEVVQRQGYQIQHNKNLKK